MAKGKLDVETKEKGIGYFRTKIQVLYEQQQKEGFINITSIAREVGVSQKTVRKWIKRPGIENKKPEIKRQLKITKKVEEDVQDWVENRNTIRDGSSTRKVATKLNIKYGLSHSNTDNLKKPITHTTVRRIIKKLGLKAYKIRKVIGMSEKYKSKRISFIEEIKARGITGKNILFTDEKIFTLRNAPNTQNERVYVKPEQRKKLSNGEGDLTLMHRTKERHESQVMVSGGISYFGVTRLIFIIGSVEQNSYMNILDYFHDDLNMLSSQGNELLYFQQDGASCHKAKKTMEKIQSLFGDRQLPVSWPPKSPDLSPIELLWGIISAELYKKDYKTIDELKFELEDLWNRVPVELCQDLIANFDKRVDLVQLYQGLRYSDCWYRKANDQIDKREVAKLKVKKTAEEKLKQYEEELPLDWNIHWNPYHCEKKNDGTLQRIVVNPEVGNQYMKNEEARLSKKIKAIKKKYDKVNEEYINFQRKLQRKPTESKRLSKNYLYEGFLSEAQKQNDILKGKEMLKGVIKLKRRMKNLQDKIDIMKNTSVLEYLNRTSASNLVGKHAVTKGKKKKKLAIFKPKKINDSNILEEDQRLKGEDEEGTGSTCS